MILSQSSHFYLWHYLCARGRISPQGSLVSYMGWFPGRAFLCFRVRPTLDQWQGQALPWEESLRSLFRQELIRHLPTLGPASEPDFLDRPVDDSFASWMTFEPWAKLEVGLKHLYLSFGVRQEWCRLRQALSQKTLGL